MRALGILFDCIALALVGAIPTALAFWVLS